MNDIKVGYVSLKVALRDATRIFDLVKTLPISSKPIKPHEMHMTLMYDRSNPVRASNISGVSSPDVVYKATIDGITLLGAEGSEYRAVVLHLDAPEIVSRHAELSVFMTHSFEDFVPHVSVVYGVSDPSDLTVIEKTLTGLIGSSILLYGESFSTVKE